jgi:hypothetical protein
MPDTVKKVAVRCIWHATNTTQHFEVMANSDIQGGAFNGNVVLTLPAGLDPTKVDTYSCDLILVTATGSYLQPGTTAAPAKPGAPLAASLRGSGPLQ